MPEQNEPDTGKAKTYQSIAVYDGSNPAYFANWHTKVLSHYATWLNGEERAGRRCIGCSDCCKALSNSLLTIQTSLSPHPFCFHQSSHDGHKKLYALPYDTR